MLWNLLPPLTTSVAKVVVQEQPPQPTKRRSLKQQDSLATTTTQEPPSPNSDKKTTTTVDKFESRTMVEPTASTAGASTTPSSPSRSPSSPRHQVRSQEKWRRRRRRRHFFTEGRSSVSRRSAVKLTPPGSVDGRSGLVVVSAANVSVADATNTVTTKQKTTHQADSSSDHSDKAPKENGIPPVIYVDTSEWHEGPVQCRVEI